MFRCYDFCFFNGTGVEPRSRLLRPLTGLLYQPLVIDDDDDDDDDDDCGAVSEMNKWQGKPKFSEKTCASAALSTTDPT
jgi:hypothetical protein